MNCSGEDWREDTVVQVRDVLGYELWEWRKVRKSESLGINV